MADIAQLRFQSNRAPAERGRIILSDDGTVRIEPSDEFRDEMARLEEEALQRSHTYGTRLGLCLIAIGIAALGIGWLFGRIFGKLGSSLSEPHPVQDVQIEREENGMIRVQLGGAENRLRRVQMAWLPDEFLETEADDFLQKYHELQGNHS